MTEKEQLEQQLWNIATPFAEKWEQMISGIIYWDSSTKKQKQ